MPDPCCQTVLLNDQRAEQFRKKICLIYKHKIVFFKFGSWTYSGNFINLQIAKVNELDEPSMDTQYYVPNGEWNLLGLYIHFDLMLFQLEIAFSQKNGFLISTLLNDFFRDLDLLPGSTDQSFFDVIEKLCFGKGQCENSQRFFC